MRRPKPWFRTSKNAWYVQHHNKKVLLGDHPEDAPPPKKNKAGWNVPQQILDAFYELMAFDVSALPKAAQLLVAAIAGDDLAVAEAVRLQANETPGKLTAESVSSGSFVEQLAAVRVVHNWLALYCLEVKWANQKAGTDGLDAVARQMVQVERRYESSLKALATLRRLGRPPLVAQVNVAKGTMVVNNAPSATIVARKTASGTDSEEMHQPMAARSTTVEAASLYAIPDRRTSASLVG